MNSNGGHIKVVAMMQKYFDQAISGNWSYNPENYDNNEVPVSVMAQDLLTTYKYGWKTSYYQNTYDGKKDDDEPAHSIGWHDNQPETQLLHCSHLKMMKCVMRVQYRRKKWQAYLIRIK